MSCKFVPEGCLRWWKEHLGCLGEASENVWSLPRITVTSASLPLYNFYVSILTSQSRVFSAHATALLYKYSRLSETHFLSMSSTLRETSFGRVAPSSLNIAIRSYFNTIYTRLYSDIVSIRRTMIIAFALRKYRIIDALQFDFFYTFRTHNGTLSYFTLWTCAARELCCGIWEFPRERPRRCIREWFSGEEIISKIGCNITRLC